MRTVILPDLARVCLRSKCEVIFEGPDLKCPVCGWQGAPYREIEAMALSNFLETKITAPKQMGFTYLTPLEGRTHEIRDEPRSSKRRP